MFHYSSGLFVKTPTNDGDDVQIVDNVLKAEPWIAIGLYDIAELGIIIPIALYQTGDDLQMLGRAGENVEGVGMGDIRVVFKSTLIDPKDAYGIGLGFALPVSLPTGSETTYNSERDARIEPRLALDYTAEFGLKAAANIGYYLRDETRLLNVGIGPEMRWAFALSSPVGVDGLEAMASVFGALGLEDDLNPDDPSETASELRNSPAEFLVGARYEFPMGLHTSLAGGTGISPGVGAPEYRVLLSIGYGEMNFDDDEDGVANADDACPQIKEDIDGFQDDDGCPDDDNDEDGFKDIDDQCPDKAEDKDGFLDDDGCPDDDNDEDGVLDNDDKCPSEPEDLDGFEDEDGCPEDNDGDGIADADDQCPNEAEDKDGWKDIDGCPDPDNDADGVLDDKDTCPNVAEDIDGFEDEDGCPDNDNDRDGVLDKDDKCPTEAEVINGFEDEDGCPDKGEVKVIIKKDNIVIQDKVFFETSKAAILTKSYSILDQVAAVMRANPQITKVRVEGHTDNTGNADKNKALSQDRAAAVKDYLIKKGVDSGRLDAIGYGQEKPIAKNSSKRGRATNRRVEFIIVK